MINKYILYTGFILCLLSSCTFEKEAENKEMTFEEKFEAKRDSIVTMLTNVHGRRIRFLPQDTLIELSGDMDILLWKSSFLDKDSNIYNGVVDLNIAFIADSSDLLVEQFISNPNYTYAELQGILKIEVKDEQGNLLNFNPQYLTTIRFDPKLRMLNGMGWRFDSLNSKYYKPVDIVEVFSQPLENYDSCQGIPDIKIDTRFLDEEEIKKRIKAAKIRHKGAMMTKQEVIGYELTIKSNGFYYISRQDRQEDLQEVNIVVQLETDIKDFQAKVLLYSYDEGWGYFLQGRKFGNKQYKIVQPDGHFSLQLPLNKRFTALAYFIKEEKIYFGKTPNIQLSPNNLISLTMKEASIEEMVKQIKEM